MTNRMFRSAAGALLVWIWCACDGGAAAPVSDAGGSDVADAEDDGSDVDVGDADPGDVAERDGSGDDADDGPDVPDAPVARPYPDPGDWPPNRGPGGPTRTFTEDELFVNCAYIDGGENDNSDHHNLVTMYDGYLMMPWSPEFGSGGISFFDISDPCSPTQVGWGYSRTMRETHSVGFSQIGGRWAVVNHLRTLFDGGIEFWDLSDTANPMQVSAVEFEGFFYPDAYARVVLSVFWQAPYVYAAGADNGIFIVDALDPLNPVQVGQYVFDPILRAGQVQVIGNMLIVTAAEGPRTALLDVSDPANPQPIPGGDFDITDEEGVPREAYFTNFMGGYTFYARKEGGGGVIIYDIHDPENPVRSGGFRSEGNGGYVFVKDHYAFVGESNFATLYDITDHANITEVGRFKLEGDLDTLTPIGNVAFPSVDDEANPNEGTTVAPWALEPDTDAPYVTFVWPPDGATDLAVTSRFGVSFNEFVDVASAWEGSVRLYETDTDPAATRVDGYVSTQEVIVNFWPAEPLRPGTSYTLEIPAGGIVDFNGNPIETPFTATFTTLGR